jgi:hypothetical protein
MEAHMDKAKLAEILKRMHDVTKDLKPSPNDKSEIPNTTGRRLIDAETGKDVEE